MPFAERYTALGRGFFATAIVFFGAQHFIHGEFVTRAMPAWPEWTPLRMMWIYSVGAALVATGVAVFLPRLGRRAALIAATMFLLSAVFLHVPAVIEHVTWGHLWTGAGKGFALGGGALLAAVTRPIDVESPTDRAFVVIARVTFGGFLILGGIQHFVYIDFVKMLIPAWLPGGTFWSYFAAVALIAGGAGIVSGIALRRAALLTAIMIFLWVFLIHLPRALANVRDSNEATAVFEAVAMTGIALMLFGVSKPAHPTARP